MKYGIVAAALLLVGCSAANPEKAALRESMDQGTRTIRLNEKTWAEMLVAYPVGTTDPRTNQPSTGKNLADKIAPLTPAQLKQDQAAHAEYERLVAEDRERDVTASQGGLLGK